MKKNLAVLAAAIIYAALFNTSLSQNSIPGEGNVGIGTTTPETALDVAGSVKIDSTLTVLDSIVVSKSAHMKDDMTVDGITTMRDNVAAQRDLIVDGSAYFNGDAIFKNGNILLPYLIDNTYSSDDILTIDNTGKVKRDNLKSLVYTEAQPGIACLTDMNGNMIPAAPYWLSASNKLYTSTQCVTNPMVGIGVIPTAKLHIRTFTGFTTYPLLIEKKLTGNNNYQKLLQLDNNGLLRAREIKVDLDAWPDYVFAPGYNLMSLEEVGKYITVNKHLPNVPSACEMEEDGMNIAETNVMLMEKLEETTLYLLQLKAEMEELKLEMNELKQAGRN